MRVRCFVAIAALAAAGSCSSDGDQAAETTLRATSVCDVASLDLMELWFGQVVEVLESADGTCRFGGLLMGELTITQAPDGSVTVSAEDGYTDALFANFLIARSRAIGSPTSAEVMADVDARSEQLAELGSDHVSTCGQQVSVGSGRVVVQAIAAGDDTGGIWPDRAVAKVSFGLLWPGNQCSDIRGDNEPQIVDESWPVRFDRSDYDIEVTFEDCGDATLVLHGAAALAPDGRLVPLPDPLVLRNTGYGIVPPYECWIN